MTMGILDALFSKHFGPVFLKEKSDAEDFIEKMKSLEAKSDGKLKEKIAEQIRQAEAGLIGERQIAYELKNSGIDMFILHDIYLEKGDLSAQIDFLLITHGHIFTIECKNLYGNIEIDEKGNFIRHIHFGKIYKKEGIYSPITQNERHLNVLKEVRREVKTNFLANTIFEKTFAENYKSIVVLANPKTVLNDRHAPREIRDKVIRADQLVNYIKSVDEKSNDCNWPEADMRETLQFFLDRSEPAKSDYSKKYADMLSESVSETKPEKVTTNAEQKICPRCGSPLVLRTTKKGDRAGQQFWGCSAFPKCRYIGK